MHSTSQRSSFRLPGDGRRNRLRPLQGYRFVAVDSPPSAPACSPARPPSDRRQATQQPAQRGARESCDPAPPLMWWSLSACADPSRFSWPPPPPLGSMPAPRVLGGRGAPGGLRWLERGPGAWGGWRCVRKSDIGRGCFLGVRGPDVRVDAFPWSPFRGTGCVRIAPRLWKTKQRHLLWKWNCSWWIPRRACARHDRRHRFPGRHPRRRKPSPFPLWLLVTPGRPGAGVCWWVGKDDSAHLSRRVTLGSSGPQHPVLEGIRSPAPGCSFDLPPWPNHPSGTRRTAELFQGC